MFKMKRIIGMVLTLAMVFSMVPTAVFAADTTEFIGLELRIPSVGHGESIADTAVTLKASTDAVSYAVTDQLDVKYEWYYAVRDLAYLPEEERDMYTEFSNEDDGAPYYICPVEADAKWDMNKTYLVKATVTAKAGAQFNETVYAEPVDVLMYGHNTNQVVLVSEIHPDESAMAIGQFDFICDQYGHVTITAPEQHYTYIYRVLDGRYDEMVFDMPVGKTLGSVSVNLSDYKELAGTLNIMNNPQIIVLKVKTYEWLSQATAAVHAYGMYTIPLALPTITVDRLEFGAAPFMIQVGSAIIGNYHSNIAQAEFKGWFTDMEGTVPATSEQNAFVVFTVRCSGLFADGLVATDFSLNCSDTSEAYSGVYMKELSPNEYQVSFSIPTDRINVTIKEVGAGGRVEFHDYPERDVISMMPLGDSYEKLSIDIWVQPGYYVQSIKINGEALDDNINPFAGSAPHQIPNNQDYYTGFRFVPSENTVIEVVFAPCDTIIIDYGYNQPVFTGSWADETKWHSTGAYYVSETYNTELCHIDAFQNPKMPDQSAYILNTKPDGTGMSAKIQGNHFIWEPTAEYANGVAETITLYVIMRCDSHNPEDWNYEAGYAATCTATGVKAHRYCDYCNTYEILTDNGYVFASADDIIIEKVPHAHTQYTDNGNGTHTVRCENCTDYYIEEHNHKDGICACGNRLYIPGDMNEDGSVDDADAIYLLYYTIFGDEDFPIYQPADLNGDGVVSDADAVHLLYYTIFPEDYPIN